MTVGVEGLDPYLLRVREKEVGGRDPRLHHVPVELDAEAVTFEEM